MANRRFLRFLSVSNNFKCQKPFFHLTVSVEQFSTTPYASNSNTINSKSNETHILRKLSDLLPISLHVSNPQTHKQTVIEAPVDWFLPPEEKLRGVFLQNLKGEFAIERALTNCNADLSVDVVDKVLNRGNLDGKSMVVFFNWAVKQEGIGKCVSSYNILLRALGRRKFVDFMLNVVRDLRKEGLDCDLETLEIVVDSLVRARQVNKAIQMVGNEEFGFGCDTECLNVVLKCLCTRSHVGTANKCLNSVKGKIPFNGMTYNIVLGGWARCGRVQEIEGTLKLMVEDGFTADCLTYSYITEGLGRAGMIGDAVRIFDGMKEKGCEPDTDVYNAMILNFISLGDLRECMRYYRCLLSSNHDPSLDTYTKLICAFIKAREVANALEVFDEMLAKGIVPTTGTMTSFIEPLCHFGPPHAAMMFYQRARKIGCKISLKAYKLLLMRLSRFGKCGMLLGIWEEMQESGYSTDVEIYEHIINGLCNIGQLENATLVMEECLQKGFCPSRLIYSKLSNKLLASNKVEKAYKLFLKMKGARTDENARRYWRANGWHF